MPTREQRLENTSFGFDISCGLSRKRTIGCERDARFCPLNMARSSVLHFPTSRVTWVRCVATAHQFHRSAPWLQIQANLGEGHVNIINAFEAVLTETHLALVMEYAACGSLTSYVANRWQVAQHTGLFLSEDEARFFMRVSTQLFSSVSFCFLLSP